MSWPREATCSFRSTHRDFFVCVPNFPPPFFEWGWGGTTRIELKPLFPQWVLEQSRNRAGGGGGATLRRVPPAAPSRAPRREAAPQPLRPPAPTPGGDHGPAALTAAAPGLDNPGRAGWRWGCSAGSCSPAPTGSPWLLFLCVKIPPPAQASLPAFPTSVSLHPKFYRLILPAPEFSPQLHLCTPASLCHIFKPPRSWGGPFSHPSISRMYPQGRHPVSTETPPHFWLQEVGAREGTPACCCPRTHPSVLPHSPSQTPLQSGQPFKFSVLEICDRIKEEFQFLQAQYHR